MDPFLEDSPKASGGIDIKGLWRSFWRRRLLFAVPFLLCLTMAFITIKIMTPIYYAKGQIEVRTSNLQSRLITDETRTMRRPPRQSEIREEIENLVTSPRFLSQVIEEFKLGEAIRESAEMAGRGVPSLASAKRIADGRLQRMIRIDIDGRNLYTIGVIDPNSTQAYELTKYILDLFMVEYRASRVQGKNTAREFLEGQKVRYEAELNTAEEALAEFLGSMAGAELTGNPINASNLATAEEKLALMRERYNGQDATELRGLETSARGVLGALPAMTGYAQDHYITRILRELEDLGVTWLIHGTLEPTQELENELGQLRVRLNSRVEDQVAVNHPNLGLMDRNRISQYIYLSLQRTAESRVMTRMGTHIRAFRDFAARQPGVSARLQELQDEVLNQRELVQRIEGEITQNELNAAAGMSDVITQIEIRREPRMPSRPSEPDKIRLAFMGFVLSFVLGLGLVVLSVFMDRSFTSVADIEGALDLKVIGTLPVIRDDFFERKRELRILRWVTIILGILAIAAVGFLVIYPRLV